MLEAGVVIDIEGLPLYWHLPPGRSGGSLPDSKELWEVFWENRHRLLGFAHSHPGNGRPWPSTEDLTTFLAVEQGLGKSLNWWIATMDRLSLIRLNGRDREKIAYSVMPIQEEPFWLEQLRFYSEDKKEE